MREMNKDLLVYKNGKFVAAFLGVPIFKEFLERYKAYMESELALIEIKEEAPWTNNPDINVDGFITIYSGIGDWGASISMEEKDLAVKFLQNFRGSSSRNFDKYDHGTVWTLNLDGTWTGRKFRELTDEERKALKDTESGATFALKVSRDMIQTAEETLQVMNPELM